MSQPSTNGDTTSTGPAVKMTITNPETGIPTVVTGQTTADKPKEQSTEAEIDWQERYSGQLKVNRDLEGKLNSLRNGLAGALGLEDKKASTDDLVTKLTESVDSIKHDLLVEQVARENKIVDSDDLELLRGLTDETAMRKLAARLAATDEPETGNARKPKAPKPDGSVGTGDGKPKLKAGDAGKAEAARRFGDKGQNK